MKNEITLAGIKIRMERLITLREAMVAANAVRVQRQEALAYDETKFVEIADNMEKLFIQLYASVGEAAIDDNVAIDPSLVEELKTEIIASLKEFAGQESTEENVAAINIKLNGIVQGFCDKHRIDSSRILQQIDLSKAISEARANDQ